MKSWLGLKWVAVCLAAGAFQAQAATNYYVNDSSQTNDVFTSAIGHPSNPGTTNSPKATLANVIATCNLQPGDTVYIDTGTYPAGTIVSNTVNGTAGNPIRFIGSTNGVILTGSGTILSVQGRYLTFQDIRTYGGQYGVELLNASYCTFERIWAVSNATYAFHLITARTNQFRRCVAAAGAPAMRSAAGALNNYLENCVLLTSAGTTLRLDPTAVSNMTSCIVGGSQAFISSTFTPPAGSHNLFYGVSNFGSDIETLSDLVRAKTNWTANSYADPRFVNEAALDFHVQSPAGCVSNGVWVTNSAYAYSPAIDFGPPSSQAYTNEPAPNGDRVNIGLSAGTGEASKSRTNAWLFAMSHNDGGSLIQTGRLEWTSGYLTGATVDVQFSTNLGASWSNIASVAATNGSFNWAPTAAQQHPAVLWRVVVATNTAIAATNARIFAVRAQTNTTFSFYVNDTSTNGDIHCTAAGSSTNNGLAAAAPRRTLQSVLDAYALAPGDTVYIDTGNYETNFTTIISAYDSGVDGRPVRIVGSSRGAVFSRANTSANTLQIEGARFLEISDLQFNNGLNGLFGNGAFDLVFQRVQFKGNQTGVNLVGSGARYLFENCLAADNVLVGINATGSETNRWLSGVIWGSPTSTVAKTTSLSISNSIVGGGTALFGDQVVPGDYNLVWQTQVGLSYSTFSALQNAAFGWGRSLFADPLFLNTAGQDFHLQSPAGMVSNGIWVTNAALSFSPGIDLGNPAAAYANEPMENGARLNAGMYGNTDQASKSRTNLWLQTLSYMDGGTLDAQAGSWLRWTGSAFAPSNRVTLWLSRDGGSNWVALVTNLVATNGQYYYQNTSTNDPSSLFARWKVTLEGYSPEVASQTPTNFSYKNGAYTYFVNDNSRSNDVWCTAVGNDGNLGVSEGSPMASLAALLLRYELKPGDRVYVDTGTYYYPSTPPRLTSLHSGVATNPVWIIGSTNRQAGGSQFGTNAVSMSLGFEVQAGAAHIVVKDLIINNVTRGVSVINATNVQLQQVEVRNAADRAFDIQANTRDIDLLRCVAHGGGIGVSLQALASNVTVRQSLLWQNRSNAVYAAAPAGLTVENSILASTNANAALYSLASLTNFSADYNGLYAGPVTRVGVNRTTGARADNLYAWNTLTAGQDLHSIPGDPLLANPASFDYHLKTEQTLGRWLPNGLRTSDPVSSPLLDAGNPATSVGLEPVPHGGRINIGNFGGTAEASIALQTPWLRTVTFGDAGSVVDGTVPLRWTAGGGFSNETVNVEVSVDGGRTWGMTVASGVPATNGLANWLLTGLPNTPAAVWRVSCVERTNVVAQSSVFFSIRNQPLNLYLCTADTNGAVYTTAPGAADNWMATSNAPLNSLATAFDRYDLEPGDRIWVDTGLYEEARPVLISMKNSGSSNDPVRVTGNPQVPYNASVLKRASRTVGSNLIQLNEAEGVRFDSLAISNAWIGIVAESSRAIALDRVRVAYCLTNALYVGATSRVDVTASILEQSLYTGLHAHTGAVVKVYNSIMRDNARAGILLQGGDVEVKNSVLLASGSQRYIYYWGSPVSRLASDYNNIRAENNAYVAGGEGRQPDRFLIDWQASSAGSNDVSSFGYDSAFANAAALDFHLRSQYGRYDPGLGQFVTNDTVTSRLIDLGDPAFSYANEPTNNGDRINVGLYGNTAQASKSSGQGSLVPLTMSDGGTIRGETKLYWSFNGISNNAKVDVQFSWNGGNSWTNIATNIFADVGRTGLVWQTTNFQSTVQGVWRVCTTNGTCGQTEILFAIKNEPAAYYINDAVTNGDVYCTAAGRSTNTGLSAESPLTSLEDLMGRYKVEHGDTVYLDTGVYPRSAPLVISVPSLGATNRLVIQGSTNEAAGGTVITNTSGTVIEFRETRSVDLRDLTLRGGERGLLFTKSSSNRLVRVRTLGARDNAIELGQECDQNQFIQCAALNFSRTGFSVAAAGGTVPPATNFWTGGVLAPLPAISNGIAASTGVLMGARTGRIYVSNSVFVASGPAHPVYYVSADAIRGDYNCYYLPYSNAFAWVAAPLPPAFGVEIRTPGSLGEWAEWMQCESNSMVADPLFADLAGGDLHPRSQGGRYVPASAGFEADEETSPLIDAADPLAPWSLEPGPNGGRADIGPYGNHPLGSRTPTNGTYVLLTFNQGGVARGTQTLRWVARGGATNVGHQVLIQVSTNSGVNYQTLGTNFASQMTFAWHTTNTASGAAVRWRVRDTIEPTWLAFSDRDFTIHNSNLTYYVNDAATNGDAFTTAPGAAGNSGLTPDSPVLALREVLNRYDVEPGDTILVDVGGYGQAAPVEVGYPDGGTVAEPVVIRGGTNSPGTVFSGAGFEIENVRGVWMHDLKFFDQTRPQPVVTLGATEDVTLERVDVSSGMDGVEISMCSNTLLRNFSVAGVFTNGVTSRSSYNTRLEFGVIWSNGVAQIESRNQSSSGFMAEREASSVSVSNCIVGTFGIRKPVYQIRGNLYADYNDLYLVNGGLAALLYDGDFGREFDSVQSWSLYSGQDAHSLSHEPRMANAVGGDFHLLSSAGRYDPAVTNYVMDPPGNDSPLIDAGDPALACTEPAFNGGRVNIGRYGNTAQASKTPADCALTLLSFNDGGRATGTNVPVRWNARGAATNGTVAISYSADGGGTWTVLATNQPALAGMWPWNSMLSAPSVRAKLKLESSAGCSVQSEKLFSVRNAPVFYYVNDASTSNDVYCSAIGSDANTGLSTDSPMADLNKLLERYDLESGDVVYIDTGTYQGLNPWRISQADSAGDLGVPPVVFQGSTNSLWGGTVLDRAANTIGIQADYAVGLRLRNITISNTVGSAVFFNDCYDVGAEWVAVGAGNVAFRLSGGSQMRVEHCLALNANQGVLVENWTRATNTVFPVIEHCVFWETAGSTIEISGQNKATVRHSILSSGAGQNYVYEMGNTAELIADYNSIILGTGGRVFRRAQLAEVSPVPIIYETVGAWSAASGQDAHSYDGDPLLANPGAKDFHVKSRAGRYDDALKAWTNDAVSSPLIDAGDPGSTAWTNEPATNGYRVNVGLYGGTPWASKSTTNSALYLLTLNRGGVASGQVALNWQAAGLATGHTVRLEVTVDDGTTWVRVATNISAALGGVTWNSLGLPSSPLAKWRVQDEQEAGVEAVSELNFVLHNGPVFYYVNDEFQTNDVYCSAPGASTNSGARADSPKRWISEILETYNLEPGDVVYVDTGRYQTPVATAVGDLDSGATSQDPSAQVTFLGSTNELAGGSLYIVSNPEESGFELDGAYGIRFKRLGIQGASNGIALSQSFFIAHEWLDIRDCENGVRANQSSNLVFSHVSLVANRGAGVRFWGNNWHSMKMDACLFWSNRFGLHLEQGSVQASNSILGMLASGSLGYYVHADAPQTVLQSDYNNLYVGHAGAAAGALQRGVVPNARTTVYATASAWAQGTGQDANSLGQDPQLADPGNGDFHLKSTRGRYQPGTGWVVDTNSSPLIDAGHPGVTSWILEPDPDGGRLNLGLYGGTAEASKSPEAGSIIPTYPNGGIVSGVVTVKWTVVGAATNYTLNLDYSSDNGTTWTNIVQGWPAILGSYEWDSVPYGRSALARWRAYCLEDPSIYAVNLGPFILANPVGGITIPYYVNDASTNGDVFCTAPGDDANNGLTPATPKENLQTILNEYQLAPVDVVYVDAGVYPAGSPPIIIDQTDSGWSNQFVTIQGSTNPLAPTVFQAPGGFSTPYAFSLQYAENVRLRNLTIRNASVGVESFQTIGCEFDQVRIENNPRIGINLVKSEDFRVYRSVLWNNASLTGGVAIVLGDSSLVLENSVLWDSPVAVLVQLGRLTVTNCALKASGSSGRIYSFSRNASVTNDFRGDHNSYTRINGALICEQDTFSGGSDYYNDLPVWSTATASDGHSMVLDPLFANEIEGDFHERSSAGRFNPATGTWTADSATNIPPLSPLIDAGAPGRPWELEPEPNGDIINIGAYGNTAQASLTQTNPPWLRTVSYNEPGIMSGNARLYWLHGGLPPGALVRLEYSTDYEVNWHLIASNLLASAREHTWNVSALPLSLVLNWRVVYQTDTNIYDVSDFPVSVKTRNYDYFVNDASTNGDVYCHGPGLDWDPVIQYGTNSTKPLNSLQALLEHYPVGAGDRVYVDTGVYPVSDAARIVLDGQNMGTDAQPLKLYGSTNSLAGGTLFQGNGTANGMDIQNTRNIELHHFRFTGALHGLAMLNVSQIQAAFIESFNNRSNGIWVLNGADVETRNSRLWKNGRYGYASADNTSGGQNLLGSSIWGNQAGAVYNTRGTLNISNSILCVTNATDIITEAGIWEMTGDYNLYGTVPGSRIGTNSVEKTGYANLRQWQAKARDIHSLVVDPLFVDPAAGNFHLQSRAGYWSNGTWVASASTSWGIDAGDPTSTAYTNEPATNGLRLNQGAYGGTPEASRTDASQPELLPVTFRDGGVAPNGQPLYWLFRGINPTNTVKIEYSPDGGSNWVLVATGLRADSAPYNWFTAVEPTPEARWRIILEGNTNIWAATATNFILRPQPITYYVNDANPTGDVYTTAIGLPSNRGYSSNSPLHSIQAVLDKYQLLGGDTIKVDTGVYELTNSVTIGVLMSGDSTNRTGIIGSTNLAAGGSVFLPGPGMQDPGFVIQSGHDFNLSYFRLSGFTNGVSVNLANDCTLAHLDIQGSTGVGIPVVLANRIRMEHVLIREGQTNAVQLGASQGINLDGCVLWSNRSHAISFGSAQAFVTNSVIEAGNDATFCYYSSTGGTIRADFNNLYIHNGAQIAFVEGLQYEKLPQWVRSTSQDQHSLSTDPLFHDPDNGDFHLRSVAGRYQNGTGWTNDAAATNLPDFSPLIDMGAPKSAWSNEPAPNGGRRNIGLYGSTWQASKSNTNRWLLAVSAMSGGITYGRINLIWGAGSGIASNEMTRLEYSFDNGSTWIRIAEAAAGAGEYVWDSHLKLAGSEIWPSSPGARWRIFLLANTNVWDMTDTYFGLRNSPFKYYLNDESRTNDIYTYAIGSDTNLGFYPAAPKLTLVNLLQNVDLDPTDQIYFDTGVYRMDDTNAPVRWVASDGGESNSPVIVRGSTHADGSLIIATNIFPGAGFFFMQANYVDLQDLRFAGGSAEFMGIGLAARSLRLTNGSLRIMGDGCQFSRIEVDRGDLLLSGQDNRIERIKQRWGFATISGTNAAMLYSAVYATNQGATGIVVNAINAVISNTTVVSARGSAIGKLGGGTLRLGHNILVANGSESNSVIVWEQGGLRSDWNNLLARDQAWIGNRDGKWEKLAYWQAASGLDSNSVSFEPLFQNESAGDFHLNSTAGRWSLAFNDWDYGDTTNSPLIDLGDPWIGTGDEPMYNGYRRNLGAYGGTEQASKSRTNFWLTALTQNDGGVLKGTNVLLRWAAGNAAGKTVTLEYFDGVAWSTIVSGVSADAGIYVWNTLPFPDSFSGRWRVVGGEDTNVWDQTDNPFQLRNLTKAFYVNDGSQTEDVYCGAIGLAGNDGLTTNTPKATLQQVLDAYDLEGGDAVYVDTGTYAATSNVRVIWSRSGDTNADVVIQGNPNGPYTVLTRTGSTNYPAIGLDVKASRIVFSDLAVQGPDRGLLMDSNRNATVRGTLIRSAATGVAVENAVGFQMRNSAIVRPGIGVSLYNTRTSVLENLTFALPTQAGIQMAGTVADTLQNNIFVPDAGAYAYAIGGATSLLSNAAMDFNLYDFGLADTGFYDGATNELRRWQLSLNRDFRSAITNADLVNLDSDLHPLSQYGRWTPTGWVTDGTTSWAVDHGNPDSDHALEPADNGSRINIGRYGNTVQASKGSTNIFLELRTLTNPDQIIPKDDQVWPMIWTSHLVNTGEQVLVQFSGDGGATWQTLTNVSAYTEYYIWQARAEFQTVQGRWRVISENDPLLLAESPYGTDGGFDVRYFTLGITSRPYPVQGLMRFNWQGGVQGLAYRIEYSDNFGKNWYTWEPRFNGPAPINRSSFTIPVGGSQTTYVFEDRTSYLHRTRWYRVVEIRD